MVKATVLCTLLLLGCAQDGLDAPLATADLDVSFFRCNVQPVLAARCSFMACHGSARRPLSVFSVQRQRLMVPWTEQETPLTADELAENFRRTAAFAGDESEPAELLTKPLDVAAGGYYHVGRELYGGGDVFTSADDRGYQLLERWIAGETASSDCQPTEEVGL